MTGSLSQTTIPDELTRRWSISSAFLIADTPSSLVYRVKLDNSTTAIFKSLKPRGMGELPGFNFLEWRNGTGAVKVLEREGTVCLIEDAGDITLREYRLQHGEEACNDIIIEVLKQLHSAGHRPPGALTPLNQHFKALFNRAEKEDDPRLYEPIRFCAGIAEQLLATQKDVKPLHGDLHHDNIISGGPRGWLAIDPQGLLGDSAYDVANIFGNPLNAFKDVINPARIDALAALFNRKLGRSKDDILRYAVAHAGLSICWSLEDGVALGDSVNAQERLAFIGCVRPML